MHRIIKAILVFCLSVAGINKSTAQCACCAGAGTGSNAGDDSNGVLLLEKHRVAIEGIFDYRKTQTGETVHHHHGEDVETPLTGMLITSAAFRYGVSNRLNISTSLPYVFLYTDHGNDRGIGDASFLGTYSVLKSNSFHIALHGGVELPTGIQKGSNFDNTTVVVGSGSWDPMLGVSIARNWNKWSLYGNAMYKLTTTGFENNYYGSLSTQNVAIAFRVFGANRQCVPDSINVMPKPPIGCTISLGYTSEWLDQIKEKEVVDVNSGHYLGFATLRSVFTYKNWSIPLSYSVPILDHLNGDQNSPGFRIRLGLINSF